MECSLQVPDMFHTSHKHVCTDINMFLQVLFSQVPIFYLTSQEHVKHVSIICLIKQNVTRKTRAKHVLVSLSLTYFLHGISNFLVNLLTDIHVVVGLIMVTYIKSPLLSIVIGQGILWVGYWPNIGNRQQNKERLQQALWNCFSIREVGKDGKF